MPNRTQIVCLHEGLKGRSIDPVFIRKLIKELSPSWLRPWPGNNAIRPVDCGPRSSLIDRLPSEIKAAEQAGGHTSVLVWADVDDDLPNPEALKAAFWAKAQASGISIAQFDRVVFALSKDRLENWIEFLNTGSTDESREGPRVQVAEAVAAARKLAKMCESRAPVRGIPPSLEWSCRNWQALKARF